MSNTISNIDHTLAALNAAIREHYDWTLKLLTIGILGGEPDDDLVHDNAHLHCRFSHWLKQKAADITLCPHELADIFKTHEIMHANAKMLLMAIHHGSVTANDVNDYHVAQCAFITSIDRHKASLIAYRNMLDTLTGLPLRQLLYKDAELRMARSKRNNDNVYLLMLDIDRFKSINDTYGHNAGDEVLKAVADTLRSGTRADEALYRFGGEEFIALFNAKTDGEAATVGMRLCRFLAQTPVQIANGTPLSVTMTGGVTRIDADECLHDAIGRADKAMYYGKNHGRNRCIMADKQGQTHDIKCDDLVPL